MFITSKDAIDQMITKGCNFTEIDKVIIKTVIDEIKMEPDHIKCSNCQYWSKQVKLCNNRESFAFIYSCKVKGDDGCNKFTQVKEHYSLKEDNSPLGSNPFMEG